MDELEITDDDFCDVCGEPFEWCACDALEIMQELVESDLTDEDLHDLFYPPKN